MRAPLSPARIVTAAVQVADAGGLNAVSMRSVARALEVEAMSLYHHVRNKAALVEALVEWIYQNLHLPDASSPWRAEMENRSRVARTTLLAHPWALGLLESQRAPGPHLLDYHEATLACLRQQGFDLALTAHTVSLLDAYVFGFVLTEISLPIQVPDDAVTLNSDLALDPAHYPHMTEFMADYVLTQDYTYGAAEFEHGLALILDAIEARLATQSSPGC